MTVTTTKGEFQVVVRISGSERVPPLFRHSGHCHGINDTVPSPPVQFIGGSSGVFIEPTIEPDNVAVGASNPCQLRNGIRHGAKPSFTFPHRLLRLLASGHIMCGPKPLRDVA